MKTVSSKSSAQLLHRDFGTATIHGLIDVGVGSRFRYISVKQADLLYDESRRDEPPVYGQFIVDPTKLCYKPVGASGRCGGRQRLR